MIFLHFKFQKEKIDFGYTTIDNIFLQDYMPTANGDDVKVYLLGYQFAQCLHENFSNETIARHLNFDLSRVRQAWQYWADQGIVNIIDLNLPTEKIEFINLKQLYVDHVYRFLPNLPDLDGIKPLDDPYTELIENHQSLDIKTMFQKIEVLMGRFLNFNEKRQVNEWLKQYATEPDVVLEAFTYAIETKNVKDLRYISTILANWHDQGIRTMNDLQMHLEENRKNYPIYGLVRNRLGFTGRQLTAIEKKIIDTWVDTYELPVELIELALSYASKTTNPHLNYFNAILENWHKSGIKSVDEAKHATSSSPSKNKKSPLKHNFDQQYNQFSEEELEKLARSNYSDSSQTEPKESL